MNKEIVNSYDCIKHNLLSYQIFGAFPPTDPQRRKIYFSIQIPIHCLFSFFFYYGFYYYAFTQNIEKAAEAISTGLFLSNVMLKSFILIYYQKDVLETFEIMKELDQLTKQDDEKEIMRKTIKRCQQLQIIVHIILFFMIGTKVVGVIINFNGDRVPLFPIWVPYDYISVTWIYTLTMLYQFVAIELQVVGYSAAQLFAPVTFCMIIGHVRVLQSRLRKLGYNRDKSMLDNHKELIECAKTFNLVYRIFRVYGRIVTLQMITQFFLSSMVLSTQIVLTIYFSTTMASMAYAALYVLNIIVTELLMTCWYGEELISETDKFTHSCFEMNWIDQNRKFKRDLLMLMQRSQKNFELVSGIMHINLKSFMAILRFAYSTSLILRNMKNRDEN